MSQLKPFICAEKNSIMLILVFGRDDRNVAAQCVPRSLIFIPWDNCDSYSGQGILHVTNKSTYATCSQF